MGRSLSSNRQLSPIEREKYIKDIEATESLFVPYWGFPCNNAEGIILLPSEESMSQKETDIPVDHRKFRRNKLITLPKPGRYVLGCFFAGVAVLTIWFPILTPMGIGLAVASSVLLFPVDSNHGRSAHKTIKRFRSSLFEKTRKSRVKKKVKKVLKKKSPKR